MFSSCAAKRKVRVADTPVPVSTELRNFNVVVWGETPEEKVWNGFMSTGLFTSEQTAALIGNVIGESLSPTKNEIRRPVAEGEWRLAEFGEGGYGISQWTNSPGGTFYKPGGGGRRDNFVDAFIAAGFGRFYSETYNLAINELLELITDEELNAKYAFQISYLLDELSERTPRGTIGPFEIDNFPPGESELEVIQQMTDIALITSFIQYSFLRPAVTHPRHPLYSWENYINTLNRRTAAAQSVFSRYGESRNEENIEVD
jgi:hypothetical protein